MGKVPCRIWIFRISLIELRYVLRWQWRLLYCEGLGWGGGGERGGGGGGGKRPSFLVILQLW